MKIKKQIIDFISSKIDDDPYSSLENFALFVLQKKISDGSVSPEERLLIINGFLSNYLEFDPDTDEPINRTDEIEQMIDFLLAPN